jgi:hypothetical protein
LATFFTLSLFAFICVRNEALAWLERKIEYYAAARS